MIHSPTLMAPLVRHDRTHDQDQTVVTLWSLEAWLAPARLSRGTVAWHRAMLARAVRHADAVVVPTHAMAAQLAEIAPLGGRIRVIAGAPTAGFGVPGDAAQRVRRAGISAPYIVALASGVVGGGVAPTLAVAAELDLDVVVIGVEDSAAAGVVDSARLSGHTEDRVHALVADKSPDRAALLAGAVAVVAPSVVPVYPWRLLESLAVGAPVVAASTDQNAELLVDAASLVEAEDADALDDALRRIVQDGAASERLRVLSADRSRAFSWSDSANRVWQLHAEL